MVNIFGKFNFPPENRKTKERNAALKYLTGGLTLTAFAMLLNVTEAEAASIAANYAPSGEGKTINYTPTEKAEAYNPFVKKMEEGESEEYNASEEMDGGDGDKLDVAPTPADTVEGYVQKGRKEFNFDKKTGNGEMWDYYGTVSADKTPCKNGPFYTNDSYKEEDLRQLGTVFGTGGENYILCYNYGPDKSNPGKYVAHIVKVPATTKVYRPKGGKSDELYLAKCGNRLVPVKQLKPDTEPTKVDKKEPKTEEPEYEPTLERGRVTVDFSLDRKTKKMYFYNEFGDRYKGKTWHIDWMTDGSIRGHIRSEGNREYYIAVPAIAFRTAELARKGFQPAIEDWDYNE